MDNHEGDNNDWKFDQVQEGTDEFTFPIGYSIEFSPGPQDLEEDDGSFAHGCKLGSQVLPVSSNLRSDWDGVPVDGAEYLFIVRQEAKSRPRVVAKTNPYKLPQPSFDPSQIAQVTRKASQWSPSPAWRSQFIEKFTNMRKSINLHDPWHWELDEEYRRPPPDNDESNWKIFIFGKKANIQDYPPRAPVPLFLKALDQVTVLAVLSHYQTWIQENINLLAKTIQANSQNKSIVQGDESPPENVSLLSPFDGSWLIGLLSVLDSVLTCQDVFMLRELARTCRQVIKITNAALELGQDYSAEQESGVAWMVITAVADIWGQKDLWED